MIDSERQEEVRRRMRRGSYPLAALAARALVAGRAGRALAARLAALPARARRPFNHNTTPPPPVTERTARRRSHHHRMRPGAASRDERDRRPHTGRVRTPDLASSQSNASICRFVAVRAHLCVHVPVRLVRMKLSFWDIFCGATVVRARDHWPHIFSLDFNAMQILLRRTTQPVVLFECAMATAYGIVLTLVRSYLSMLFQKHYN